MDTIDEEEKHHKIYIYLYSRLKKIENKYILEQTNRNKQHNIYHSNNRYIKEKLGRRRKRIMGGKKRKKSSSARGFNNNNNGKTKFDAFAKAKANPFDVQNNKRNKQVVLGRKIKGKTRDVSKAKLREGQSRDETLLEELKKRGKANAFIDKRFGEARSDITQEERDLSRFIKLQKSRFKKNKYNLGDDNDDATMSLTHGGKPLNAQHLGDYRGENEEEGEDGGGGLTGLSAEIVNQMHFGGGNLNESYRPDGTKKTKEEIYSELIAKSKMYKAERRRQKDLDEREMEGLDDQLDDIRKLLDFKPSKAEEKNDLMNRLLNKYNNNNNDSNGQSDKNKKNDNKKNDKYDDYDSLRRGLTYDARAAAADRMKTDEEKAKEEKEKLEKLEKARLKRMEEDVDTGGSSKKSASETNNGDGLGVNFQFDESFMPESSEEEEDLADVDDDDEVLAATTTTTTVTTATAAHISTEYDPKVTMPYTFKCPSNRRELREAINQWAPPNVTETGPRLKLLFSRLLKCNSIHLAAANRGKLQALFTLMLEYICKLKEYPKCSSYLNVYAVVMYKLMQVGPEAAANSYRILLTNIQRRASHHTARARATASKGGGGDYGEDDKKRRAWPSGGEMIALKMLGTLFPLSDFRHVVTTPASILLGQLLSQCPVRGPKDLAAGIFCSTLQLYYSENTRRLAPEAVNFLMSIIGKSYLDSSDFKKKKKKSTGKKRKKKSKEEEEEVEEEIIETLVYQIVSSCPPLAASNLKWVFNGLTKKDYKLKEVKKLSPNIFFNENDNIQGIHLLNSTFSLMKQVIETYSSSTALPEMLVSLKQIFPYLLDQSKNNITNFPKVLLKSQETLSNTLATTIERNLKNRRPIQMQREIQRPKAIQSYRPMFDEEYIVRKDNDPNRERAEIKKLKRQIARERKGAAREIKKDSLYIARKQHEEREEWEADVQKKYNNVIDFLDKQQSGFKKAIKEGTMHGGGMKAGRRKKKVKAF